MHSLNPKYAWLELREDSLNDFEKKELATIRAEEAAAAKQAEAKE